MVSFAESVDTVVVNLREIAPKGFLGVPRIWEKMQQSIDYRIRDTTPVQRRVFEICMRLGRPVAEVARILGYGSPSAFTAMFRRALGKTPRGYFDPAGRAA